MTSNIENDGTVGAQYTWEGNDEVGKGEQTITKLTPNERVDTHLKFLAPWESEADAYLTINDGNNVTWGLTGENNFMARVMSHFMDMDAMVGKSYEEGLASLKTIVEADYAKILEEKAAAEAAAATTEEVTEGVN